ncbi:MAG: GNAT family N-acetyltransferase [Eubacterium sp.]|nr:GNAT family N-acetyltransferase [Eubacterium sp.]
MISKINNKNKFSVCLDIIHKSFATVAKEFNFTKENCPNHTSFMPIEKLEEQFNNGYQMFLYSYNNNYAGFFSVHIDDSFLELNTLGVLSEYRHNGIGKEIIEFSKKYATTHNCNTIKISIVEENTILRKWYESLGFKHTETKTFPNLPFTVGYMELILKSS